jgi:adenosylcobinamide-phosphate synthase
MVKLGCVLCGFLLDLLLGDPVLPIPHTVVLMGRCITSLEGILRRRFPKTPGGELAAGGVLALILSGGAWLLSWTALRLCALVHPALYFALGTFWCWQALALRDLRTESMLVLTQLERNDLPAARAALSRIVGRDTEQLDEAGIIRAAVETVAENCSDGVIAPLCYLMLGGAPLGLWYKAVNTMDSMIGYRNSRYLYFGRCGARLDDLANYLPSRFSALMLICAGFLTGQNGKRGWRIWRRDRRNHPSPNSAQCEAAVAGILGIELGGAASYFGVRHEKPTIGDATRPVSPEDIGRANRLVLWAALTALAVLVWGSILFHKGMR